MRHFSNICVALGLWLAAQDALSQDTSAGLSIDGVWKRDDKIAHVIFRPCKAHEIMPKSSQKGTAVCVVNVWVKPGTRDEKIGDYLILDLSLSRNSVWIGHAYDPQRKLTYRIELRYNAQTMTTKGCIIGGLICKTAHWERIQ